MVLCELRHDDKELRIITWNVGTLNNRRECLARFLKRRNVDFACVQETRLKGEDSVEIGEGYKLIYDGKSSRSNGVGIVHCQQWKNKITGVTRVSERIIMVKFFIKSVLINIISCYAPHTGYPPEDKIEFWQTLENILHLIPHSEMIVIGGDFNGHVGKDADFFEGIHGGTGYGKKNNEGLTILRTARTHKLAIVNTFFHKEINQLVTYRSGGNETVIDYILVKQLDLQKVQDCEVITLRDDEVEHFNKQHQPLRMVLKVNNTSTKIISSSNEVMPANDQHDADCAKLNCQRIKQNTCEFRRIIHSEVEKACKELNQEFAVQIQSYTSEIANLNSTIGVILAKYNSLSAEIKELKAEFKSNHQSFKCDKHMCEKKSVHSFSVLVMMFMIIVTYLLFR